MDATCTEGGYTVERCSGCSNTRKTNETEVLGHSMKEFSLILSATYDYLHKNKTDKQPRIDVIEVYLGMHGELDIKHIKNAVTA